MGVETIKNDSLANMHEQRKGRRRAKHETAGVEPHLGTASQGYTSERG